MHCMFYRSLSSRIPQVAVSCAVFRPGTRGSLQEILLVRRNQNPGLGLWSLPGGKLNWGESISEAAEREIWEETGLKCSFVDVFGALDVIGRDEKSGKEWHFVVVNCLAESKLSDSVPKAADDVSETRWCDISRIPNHLECTEGLEKIIHKARDFANASRIPEVTKTAGR